MSLPGMNHAMPSYVSSRFEGFDERSKIGDEVVVLLTHPIPTELASAWTTDQWVASPEPARFDAIESDSPLLAVQVHPSCIPRKRDGAV